MYDSELMINRIKSIKKEQKLSNERLSALSGVPKGTLAKILGSETKDPQISNIIKISQALGVSADYIIFGETQNLKKSSPPLSAEAEKLLTAFDKLNTAGQSEAIKRVEELTEINKYTFSRAGHSNVG